MSNAPTDKDNVFINCSNIENSALKWSFIDKILNRIDEVEAKDNFCKDTIQAYEKAGFTYFLDAKSKESQQPSHIEIPLISDNEYLCSLSKMFSSNPNEKVTKNTKKPPTETKLIDSFFNLASKVDTIIDEIKTKECEQTETKNEVKEDIQEEEKEEKPRVENEIEQQELVLPSNIPETSGETDNETVATYGTNEVDDKKLNENSS